MLYDVLRNIANTVGRASRSGGRRYISRRDVRPNVRPSHNHVAPPSPAHLRVRVINRKTRESLQIRFHRARYISCEISRSRLIYCLRSKNKPPRRFQKMPARIQIKRCIGISTASTPGAGRQEGDQQLLATTGRASQYALSCATKTSFASPSFVPHLLNSRSS